LDERKFWRESSLDARGDGAVMVFRILEESYRSISKGESLMNNEDENYVVRAWHLPNQIMAFS